MTDEPEGLTREELEQYWREERMKPFQDDPEMLEIIRTAKFDYDSTPEEDEEDIRIARERRNKPTISIDEFFQWQAETFPDDAEYTLPESWNSASD